MVRLQAHEAFEMAVLHWLRSKSLLQPLAFGGGTMLRLCHELPRYSLDMDFWFSKQVDYNAFYQRLKDSVGQEYDVTDIENKFYTILVEIRKRAGTTRLKIEIRKAVAPLGSTEEKIAFSPHFPIQVLVRGFTLNQMCRNKVIALADRAEIRDAFDLEFLVRRGIALEIDEEEREKVIARLKWFKKKDFDVTLGSVLEPELRNYYREKKFTYLENKLAFDNPRI